MKDLVTRMTEAVERFNREIIDLPIPTMPTRLCETRKKAAFDHLNEELQEFMSSELLEDEADALIDLVYVALGRLVEMGLCPGGLFDEVHEANMKKKRGMVSKRPNSLGHDAIKPEGWTPPDLRPYLEIGKDDLNSVWLARRVMFLPEVKILILGYAKHGKDTACMILQEDFSLRFQSSSTYCLQHIVYPVLKEKYGYASEQDCYIDRVNHRAEWYDLIASYNSEDATKLAKGILVQSDIYCGLRAKRELHACKNAGLFDFILWIDGSDRLPAEDKSSCTVEPWMADLVIDNNGSLEDLRHNLTVAMDSLLSSIEYHARVRRRVEATSFNLIEKE